MNDSSVEITAGLGGFLVVFALALAVWFLGRDLTRRLRRMNAAERRRVADRRTAEEDRTERSAGNAGSTGPTSTASTEPEAEGGDRRAEGPRS